MIAGKEYFDRAFIFAMTLYAFLVGNLNIRAYFTRLSSLISESANNQLFLLGTATIFLPPAISLIDMYTFGSIHDVIAVSFFILAFAYIQILTYLFDKHRATFSPDQ